MDAGFEQSDKMLRELEKKIHKEYAQAAKKMSQKANKYFAKFQQEDAMMMAEYKKGNITKEEYGKWRTRKMMQGQYWKGMKETLARDLTNTDKIAKGYINNRVVDVFALNINYGTYAIEKDAEIDTAFTLYNKDAVINLLKNNPKLLPISDDIDIPKDMRWNMQHIQSAITQGILQGESIPKIAKRLQNVTGMDERAAIRNARTAMTGAQNAGRYESMKRAAKRGVALKKGWLATLDHVTRDSHVDLDGEIVDIDKPFSNGLMYPAGVGEPAEVYNCRCRLTHEYDNSKTDWSDLSKRNTTKLGDMTYDEWKNKHKSGSTKIKAKGK